MASVHRRPNSKYWHAAWRASDGSLILRSTKQTDRTKAKAFALECERAEKKAGAGTLTESQARDILDDILKRTDTGESLRSTPIKGYFLEWLAGKEANKAAGTATRYSKSVKEFLKHLADKADKPLTSLTPRQVESFVTARRKLGLSPSTVRLDAKVIRTALNYARRKGMINTNPAEAVDLPDNDNVERGAFSAGEIKLLVDEAKGEWKSLILIAYYTGARLSDCCRMAWTGDHTINTAQGQLREGVDFESASITYWQNKTRKLLKLPLHPDLEEHLSKLASSDAVEKFIMPGMAQKGPGGRHGLSQSFKELMRRAGVNSEPVERAAGVRTLCRKSFHALRHSFTSALANAGVAPELRMKLTGHTTEAVHRGYTHHEIKTLRDAITKIPTL